MAQILVVKIGTSTDHKRVSWLSTIATLAETLSQLRQGHQVILVSSGAVGVGCARLGLRATDDRAQTTVSGGQGQLMRVRRLVYYPPQQSSVTAR